MERSYIFLGLIVVAVFLCGCAQKSTVINQTVVPIPVTGVSSNENSTYWIKINPIGTLHMGDALTITGTTNLPENTELFFQIDRTGLFNCAGNWCNRSYEISGTERVDEGIGNNRISIDVNSSDLMWDEFIINVKVVNQNISGHELMLVMPAQNISAPPVADFSWIPLRNQSFPTVEFYDISYNYPTSRNWSFGDDNFSTDSQIIHVFPRGNTIYPVALKVTNPNGTDTKVEMMTFP